jgi:ribosomal protection tetracycline resistance protein
VHPRTPDTAPRGTLNLGIVAHVDAGKTTLTERLLVEAGVLDAAGSVDAGTTRTDTMDLERRRGITIRSAVVSFVTDGVVVNLIDTPGHSDFIAEVERALVVLDAAILVVSAVEGVQSQTRVLMRVLRRLRIPTLVFVNKVDRTGADPARVLREITGRLSVSAVAMHTVDGAGTRGAAVRPRETDDAAFESDLVEALAEHDHEVLAAAVGDRSRIAVPQLLGRLRDQVARAHVCPVVLGSAATGAGISALHTALTTLLPTRSADPSAPVSGTVFKVDRGPNGERQVWTRLYAGTLRTRQRVVVAGRSSPRERVTGIRLLGPEGPVESDALTAGRIAVVRGLASARVGDVLGDEAGAPAASSWFAPPSLETVIEPVDPSRRGALHAGLTRLAEEDPLIDVRQDDVRGEVTLSLYGEVQKEVIASLLLEEFGVAVRFRESTVICIERVVGTGSAVELIGTDTNPYLATVGIRVEPAPVSSGVEVCLEVEPGSMPPAFFTAVEQAARDLLHQGPHGWDVPECRVVVTHSGYWARQSHAHGTFDKSMSSTAGDFRALTPLLVMESLVAAGTRVCEPVHRFTADVPEDSHGVVVSAFGRLGAVPLEVQPLGDLVAIVGDIPAASVHRARHVLPGLTRGEGVMTTELHHHSPVRGAPPTRPRTDADPTDREGYLRRVPR